MKIRLPVLKRRLQTKICLLGTIALVCTTALRAETIVPSLVNTQVYISDNLQAALRAGPTMDSKVITFLSSGTALETISSNGEWLEINITGTNRKGWVNKRLVQKQQGAQARLKISQTKVESLEAELNQLKSSFSETSQQSQSNSQALQSITEKFDKLSREYDTLNQISKGAVKNYKTAHETLEELAKTKAQLNELQISHTILQQDNYNRGMVHALIAVMFGVIMTLAVPRLKSSSRSNKW